MSFLRHYFWWGMFVKLCKFFICCTTSKNLNNFCLEFHPILPFVIHKNYWQSVHKQLNACQTFLSWDHCYHSRLFVCFCHTQFLGFAITFLLGHYTASLSSLCPTTFSFYLIKSVVFILNICHIFPRDLTYGSFNQKRRHITMH